MSDVALAKRGRPSGTSESIESLARKNAQRDLKLLQHATEVAEKEQARIEIALAATEPVNEKYEMLLKLLLLMRKSLVENISLASRIVNQDPSKSTDDSGDAAAKEFIAQLKGEEI